MQIVIDIDENLYTRLFDMSANTMCDMRAACSTIRNGTPLPEGAEILTKEAYSDLCMRASRAKSEGENKKEKHTCISCRFYRYDRRTWPCDDCLDYDRWKEVEE